MYSLILFLAAGAARIIRKPADSLPTETTRGVIGFMGQKRIVIPRGRELTIEAVTVGDPQPTVTWYRNGQRLRNNNRITISDGSVLTLRPFANRDVGTFRAEVQNSVSSDSETIEVVQASSYRKPLCFFKRMAFIFL